MCFQTVTNKKHVMVNYNVQLLDKLNSDPHKTPYIAKD